VIGNAVRVIRIAIGVEIEETDSVISAAPELRTCGGKARAAALSKAQRTAIARQAAKRRWNAD